MQTETVWRGTAPAIHRSIDLDLDCRRDARREPRYAGRNNDAFQAALAAHHGGVRAADCDVYRVVERDDGRRMPFPGVDAEACRRSGAANFVRLRNSWWFARRILGFSATAIYADIHDPPPDLGSFDVTVFGAILLHLAHPFRALQRAAEVTRDTIIVTDVVGPQEHLHDRASGHDPALAPMTLDPTPPPIGVVHGWALSTATVASMLHRLGFTVARVTYHADRPLSAVVAHGPR